MEKEMVGYLKNHFDRIVGGDEIDHWMFEDDTDEDSNRT
jgi:hypothetical protein